MNHPATWPPTAMTIRAQMLDEWDREIAATRQLYIAAGACDLDLIPPGEHRSLRQLLERLVRTVAWGPLVLDRFEFDLADEHAAEPPASITAALQTLDEISGVTRRLIEQSDAEWRAVWSLKRGGKPQFSMPRFTAFRRFVMSRLIHRRGELSVHLSAAGISSPAFYVLLSDED